MDAHPESTPWITGSFQQGSDVHHDSGQQLTLGGCKQRSLCRLAYPRWQLLHKDTGVGLYPSMGLSVAFIPLISASWGTWPPLQHGPFLFFWLREQPRDMICTGVVRCPSWLHLHGWRGGTENIRVGCTSEIPRKVPALREGVLERRPTKYLHLADPAFQTSQ